MDTDHGVAATERPSPDSPSCAMAFSHGRDLLTAYDRADRFGGRIATLPEIATARLGCATDGYAWTNGFVTGSAEYFGLSTGGVPIIVVAHGVGPLSDAAGTFDAYGVGDVGRSTYGSIEREEFLKLIDGAYGAVEIIELKRLLDQRKFPFTETLTFAQAMADPLVRARLGQSTDAYLRRQRQAGLDYLSDRGEFSSANTCTVLLSDPDKRPYLGRSPENGRASAHLLKLSGHVDYDHGHYGGKEAVRHVSRISELGTYLWGEPARVVGVRGTGPFDRIMPGMDALRANLPRLWQRLMRPAPADAAPPPFAALTKVGMHWFTQRAREGIGEDDGEPEFRVRQITRVGPVAEFSAPLRGDRSKILYDRREPELIAPKGANGFRLVGAPRTVWAEKGASYLSIQAEFYRIDVDTRSRMLPSAEIADDNLLLSLLPEK